MDGATVAMTLHAALECGGGEANITNIAALTSVVRTFELINYVGLLIMTFLGAVLLRIISDDVRLGLQYVRKITFSYGAMGITPLSMIWRTASHSCSKLVPYEMQ